MTPSRRPSLLFPIAWLVAAIAPSGTAQAHTIVLGLTGFPAMVLHPLVVPEHALALAAAALLAGRADRGALPLAVVSLLGGLLSAFVYLYFLPPFPGAEHVPLMIAGMLGALLALAWPLPAGVLAVAVMAVAYAIGVSTLAEGQTLAHAVQMLVGTSLGATFALGAVALCVSWQTAPWMGVAARIIGSWIAASAALALVLKLTQ